MIFKSNTMKRFSSDTNGESEVYRFIDDVYLVCERNYDCGGDTVVECFDSDDILEEFDSLDDVKEYCRAKIEQALNCRLGSDDDPELLAYKRFNEANWEV